MSPLLAKTIIAVGLIEGIRRAHGAEKCLACWKLSFLSVLLADEPDDMEFFQQGLERKLDVYFYFGILTLLNHL